MTERIDIYNPDSLTKHMINELIDKGRRFDIIPGLEDEEYSSVSLKEADKSGNSSKSIIGTVF